MRMVEEMQRSGRSAEYVPFPILSGKNQALLETIGNPGQRERGMGKEELAKHFPFLIPFFTFCFWHCLTLVPVRSQ